MIPEELYNRIEPYLQEQLDESEKAAFEAQIAANPELAIEVQIQRDITHASKAADALAFESLVKSVREERKMKKKAIRSFKFNQPYMIGIAASLALLIAAFLFWDNLNEPGSYTPEELFAEYAGLTERTQLLGYEERQIRGSTVSGRDSAEIKQIELVRDRLRKSESEK